MAVLSRPRAVDQFPPRPAPRKITRGRRLRRDWLLLAFAVPGLVWLLVFHYAPLLGNVIAFKDYQPYIGIADAPWVGFDNFSIIVNGDPAFLNALINTLVISLLQLLFVFPIPIALALLLNSLVSERVKRTVQSILYLPHFLSWVIIVAIFQHMLGNTGLLNGFLTEHDLGSVNIIGNPELFKELVVAQVVWKDTGWGMILFLAAMSRIDPTLYEAAAVDGASRLRQLWHVTLPGIKSVVALLLILRLGDVLSVGFEQILLQQNAVGPTASEVLDTYVFNNAVGAGSWGASAAAGLVKGIVGVALVLGANKVAHMFGERGVYQR